MHWLIYTDGSCHGNPGPGGWAYAKFVCQEPDFDRLVQSQSATPDALGPDPKASQHAKMGQEWPASQCALAVGSAPRTTNNRMELWALIAAMEAMPDDARAILYSDSKYCLSGLQEWLPQWVRRNWRTAAKKPVKNADLWQRLAAAWQPQRMILRHVLGHSQIVGNELADELANVGSNAASAASGNSGAPLRHLDAGATNPAASAIGLLEPALPAVGELPAGAIQLESAAQSAISVATQQMQQAHLLSH